MICVGVRRSRKAKDIRDARAVIVCAGVIFMANAGSYPAGEGSARASDALAAAAVGVQAIKTFEGILGQLMQAAMSNPLIGILVSLVVVDLAEKGGIIQPNTALMMKIIIGASAGLGLTSEIIQDFTKLISISGNANPSLIQPTTTTLVIGQGANSQELSALLAKLAQK